MKTPSRHNSGAWRNTDLLLEAVKNVFAPKSRLRTLLLFVVILGVAFTAFRSVEISRLDRDVHHLADAGRNILSVQGQQSSSGFKISRTSCEALADTTGVIAAGVLVQEQRLSTPQLGFSVPTYAASLSLVPELRSVDVVVGTSLRKGETGSKFNLAIEGVAHSAIVGELKPNGLPLNGAITKAISPGVEEVDQCIVILDQRQHANSMKTQILTSLEVRNSSPSTQAVVADLSNPYEQFHNRIARFAPLALSLLLSVIIGGLAQSRSNELAAYRLSGTSRLSLVKLLCFEAAVILTIYWASGVLAASLMLYAQPFGFQLSMLADHLAVASGTLALSGVFLAVLSRRSPMELAKDR